MGTNGIFTEELRSWQNWNSNEGNYIWKLNIGQRW